MGLTLAGVAIGLAAAFGLTRLAVGAAKVDPMVALRCD
jgi:hypothetical protein